MSALAAPRSRIAIGLGLSLVPIGMALLGFFAFPPLYSLWCELTGTGMAANNEQARAGAVADGRTIEVIFNQHATNMPVRFHAQRRILQVVPGQAEDNIFHFTNLSERPIRFRPSHSITPVEAQAAFKLELCWCFQEQVIGPGETRDFPMRFYFDRGMNDRVRTATITYTLFEQEGPR
ncbi:MAG: hypothetical protein RLZZ127_1053 [Planctomycetota bacterium]|jgi:cytochrome c oxidase assembly protein subunit 11